MRLIFDPQAFDDLQYWVQIDRKKALKILHLVDNALLTPFSGIGKPEPLKHIYSGAWSRRIDQEHRLVYKVVNDELIVLSCRYHYI
uniref:Putative mRNA interferase YoeB n=1 Tax=Candidatus Kentrum sp. MB TaxID=2138164 RepID=A0A451BF63_9GAMM|nr:MAG: toxin YoeB [Candidatus Kentron sp. MB]VFK76920.1 MAG: toxin YoeB [Candidatus Kentron sp. MB]